MALVAALFVSFTLASCGPDSGTAAVPDAMADDVLADDAITIGSFDFPESELLAHLYGRALEHRGYRVVLELGVGPRELVQPALARGLVELVPDYAGAALDFLSLGTAGAAADVEATHRGLVRTLDGTRVTALASSRAQDANAVVVTRETAERHHLRVISDLEAAAPGLTFGGPPECPTRPLCLAGLERTYGVTFGDFLVLDAGGPLTRQALDDAHIDVALMFTTDPAIADDDLVVLGDDRRLQPAENVTPLVRTEVVDRWGDGVVRAIDAVSRRLTTAALRDMNGRVVDGSSSPADVAGAWLSAEGLS